MQKSVFITAQLATGLQWIPYDASSYLCIGNLWKSAVIYDEHENSVSVFKLSSMQAEYRQSIE